MLPWFVGTIYIFFRGGELKKNGDGGKGRLMISISSIYLRYEKRDELAAVWGEKNCHPSAQNCNFYQVAKPRIFSKAKRLFEAAYNDLLIILSSAKAKTILE